ncbi:MAG: GntR family transcriptional regulator [Pseudonocardiaceae bacterium]
MSARHTAWEIAEELRTAITRGDYEPGARLPSRATLSQTYEVAPATVVSALNTLRGEGLMHSAGSAG